MKNRELDRRHLLAGAALAGTAALLPQSGNAQDARPPEIDAPDVGSTPVPIPEQAPQTETMAHLPDVDLWYWDTGGTGEPVILFHPVTGSSLVWSYQQPFFAKAGYRVIAYSRRGFYKSGTGPKDKPGTGADDLKALIDVLKIKRFHAVSTAGGAFVVADYVLSYPETLISMVLGNSILNVQAPEFADMQKRLSPPNFNEAMPPEFRELSPSYRAANAQGMAKWMDLNRISTAGTPVRQPNKNKVTLETLGTIKTPTLLMAGDSDLIAPPPVLRLFRPHIPGAQLVVLPECGHSGYWEQPDIFNREVLRFLKAHKA